MKIKDILENFGTVASSPIDWLKAWKGQTGRKIIGCFPMYVPEEMIHAAGMLPVSLQGDPGQITLADDYIQSYVCYTVRGNLELSLRGEYSFLDGIVFANACTAAKRLSDLQAFLRHFAFHYNFHVPQKVSSDANVRYLEQQILQFKIALGKFCGHEVTESALRNSILLYNRNRSLLKQLYDIRYRKPGILRNRDVGTIMTASKVMPNEDQESLLTELVSGLEVEPWYPQKNRVKLLLCGNPCDQPQVDILDFLDEAGGVVIDDDLYIGRRSFSSQVSETANPVTALAERYIEDMPCSIRHNLGDEYTDYVVQLATASGAGGVLMLMEKSCDPYIWIYPLVKSKLDDAGIPLLALELDSRQPALGQVKTRIQAFIEILRR